jgi:CheY-like chemotaxis protein
MDITSIMVIEDSEPDQFLCKVVIESHDPAIRVVQAYDGQQALDMLEHMKVKPDLIFVDINMAGMDGFEFLDAFRDKAWSAHSKIVILSSSSQKRDLAKARDYKDLASYINKPLRKEDLAKLIKSLDS